MLLVLLVGVVGSGGVGVDGVDGIGNGIGPVICSPLGQEVLCLSVLHHYSAVY